MKLLPQNYQSTKRQSGVALVVCLVLLLVITLISIAGLEGAAVQEKMATNAQQFNETFQSAESAMSNAIVIIDGIPNGGISGNNQALADTIELGFDTPKYVKNDSLSTSYMDVGLTYIHTEIISLTPGISLNVDENSTTIGQQRFVLEGEAKIKSSGARSILRQGISYE